MMTYQQPVVNHFTGINCAVMGAPKYRRRGQCDPVSCKSSGYELSQNGAGRFARSTAPMSSEAVSPGSPAGAAGLPSKSANDREASGTLSGGARAVDHPSHAEPVR